MAGHTSTASPAEFHQLTQDGAAVVEDGVYAPAGSIRGFRAGSRSTLPVASAVDATKGQRAQEHQTHGTQDTRRGASTILPDTPLQPVTYRNALDPVVMTRLEAPPERPRQGWTGADPTRTATQRRPLFMRGFDKLIADHPIGTLKVEHASPLAARPHTGLSDVAHPMPSPGGSTGTQAAGVGPGRNSFRIMPRAWDSLLVNNPVPAAGTADVAQQATAAQAARSWRTT
jgi:hypothetical protein